MRFPNSSWKWVQFSWVQTKLEVPLTNACDNCQDAIRCSTTNLLNPLLSSISLEMKLEHILSLFIFFQQNILRCTSSVNVYLFCHWNAKEMFSPINLNSLTCSIIVYASLSLCTPSKSHSKATYLWNCADERDRGGF